VHVSRRTILFFVGAVALSFGALGLADAAVLDSTAQLALVNLSEPLVLSLCALMVFWMALHFAQGEPLRRQWVPIGLGLLVFALGDVVYGAYEIANGAAPPSPGLADLLYALFYPLVAVGIVRAAMGYRRLVRLGSLVAIAVGLGAGLLVLAGIPFLQLAAYALAADRWDAALSLLFPAADVLFVVVPAVLMLLIAAKMRGARLAAPWIAVALGGVVFAATDMWFLYQQWAGTYRGGDIADVGWMLGGILIATGASLAADVNRVGQHARHSARDSSAAPSPAAPTA
jgi:hypothetical protein